MNNDILIDIVIDALKIIHNSCNDNNTGGNTNCIVNTIETIKLLQLCYINIDNIFFSFDRDAVDDFKLYENEIVDLAA